MNPKKTASFSQDVLRVLHGATKVLSHAAIVGRDGERGGIMERSQYAPQYPFRTDLSKTQHQSASEALGFQAPSHSEFITKRNADTTSSAPFSYPDIVSGTKTPSMQEQVEVVDFSVEKNTIPQETTIPFTPRSIDKAEPSHTISTAPITEAATAPASEANVSFAASKESHPTASYESKQADITDRIDKINKQPPTLNDNLEKQAAEETKTVPTHMHEEPTRMHEEEKYIPLKEKKALGSPRAVPSSSIGRAWGFGSMISKVAWNTATSAITSGSVRDGLKSEENAILIANTLCRMRGAALKLGQMISFQDSNMVPKVILDAFERVRNQADYMPESQLKSMLAKAYGPNWQTEIFESFDMHPIAAASIGQVHQAVLKSGERVAVKVQYPGVAKSMDSDIRNVERLLKISNLLPRGAFVETSIGQLRLELAQECDYRLEAANQEKYAEFIAKDEYLSQYISVPKVYKQFSSEHVLVTEMVEDAWTLGDLAEKVEYERKMFGSPKIITPSTSNHLSSLILYLCLSEVFNFRYMQTDPNWSNFFYSPKTKKVHLIDFGACASYPTTFTHPYMEVVYGAATMNRDLVLQSSIDLGFLTGEESDLMKDAHLTSAYIIGEPFRPTENGMKYNFETQKMTTKIVDKLPVMLKHRLTPPPRLSYALHRKLSGAFLLCCRFGAETDSASIFKEVFTKYLAEHPEFSLPPFKIVGSESDVDISKYEQP